MRKIVFLVCVGGYSGAENISLLIAKELIRRKNQVYYCAPDGVVEKFIKEQYPSVRYIKLKKFSFFDVRDVLNKIDPDVIHAVDFKVSVLCSLLDRAYIAHLHNNPGWLKKRGSKSLALLYALCKCKGCVCVSDSVMKEFVFSKRVEQLVSVIDNIVDKNKIIELSKNKYDRNFDVCFFGRLSEQKDPIRFLNIVRLLSRKYGNIYGVMIGADEGLGVECKSYIEKYNLKIDLVGLQENPYKIVANTKVVIMPSRWEGFGLTAVESMVLGVPVLATPVGGLKKVIGIKENICYEDAEFVEKAGKLLKDEYRVEMSKRVIEQAERFTDISKYIDDIEAVYRRCDFE